MRHGPWDHFALSTLLKGAVSYLPKGDVKIWGVQQIFTETFIPFQYLSIKFHWQK